MHLVSRLAATNEKWRLWIMKLEIPHHGLFVIIGIAIAAQMRTGIIGPNIISQRAVTFLPKRFLFREIHSKSNDFLVHISVLLQCRIRYRSSIVCFIPPDKYSLCQSRFALYDCKYRSYPASSLSSHLSVDFQVLQNHARLLLTDEMLFSLASQFFQISG